MKTYLVGGAVRDEILGLEPKDRDYVVTGATESDMIEAGYSKVGADFPVFLHPVTGEEYALARRERSTGPGYNDFVVEFSPDVTIEEDLARRDFTMNAVAKDAEAGGYIDPFDGIEDIRNRVINTVTEKTFIEDPVRILRMARFAAQFPAFICPEWTTIRQATHGSLAHATPERVSLELIKALMSHKPSNFFWTLHRSIQLAHWFPEIEDLIDVPAGSLKHHAEGDAYTHTMMVLDSAAKHNESIEVRFGCLVHDLGKALTPIDKWPKHHGHEAAGVPLVNALCDRLKLPNDLRRAGVLSAKYHMHVHNAYDMGAKGYVNTFAAFRNCIEVADIVAQVAWHDNEGRLPYHPYNGEDGCFISTLRHLHLVKLSRDYSPEAIEQMTVEQRKQALHKMRLNAVKKLNGKENVK